VTPAYDVVIPTVGRPQLQVVLDRLARGRAAGRVVVVDDRRRPAEPLAVGPGVEVLRSHGRGPAAARNVGWRAATAPWVAFLDDDVEPPAGWPAALAADLAACGPEVGATQGRLRVPLPVDRRPTDWERNVAGLEHARWATADMAYRREALGRVGGFDERFPRAYREDADLGLRVVADGWRITTGTRQVVHPVRPAPWHVSIGKQAGNADDALMDRLHGRDWRRRAEAPPGRYHRHAVTTAAGAVGLAALLAGRRRWATVAGAAWALGTGELAWRRIQPGPRTPGEVAAMVATSAVLPPAATWHRATGRRRARRLAAVGPAPLVDAVLLDRDGTLVVDVPYNGDPDLVAPVPGAREALDRLRAAGIRLAVVTNQSGIGRGTLTVAQVDAVHERLAELLGPFDAVLVCPHGPDDGCDCRKPRPAMVRKAAAELGVEPGRCALIGDIGSDVDAALAAGVRPILVPTPVTRPEEVAAAPEVAPNLAAAVDRLVPGGAR
jgi:histidinol-phosphate phosphatase family protein